MTSRFRAQLHSRNSRCSAVGHIRIYFKFKYETQEYVAFEYWRDARAMIKGNKFLSFHCKRNRVLNQIANHKRCATCFSLVPWTLCPVLYLFGGKWKWQGEKAAEAVSFTLALQFGVWRPTRKILPRIVPDEDHAFWTSVFSTSRFCFGKSLESHIWTGSILLNFSAGLFLLATRNLSKAPSRDFKY